MSPPFHPFRVKLLGDRVKIPRFPTDESRGYYHGTVIRGRILSDRVLLLENGDDLIVEWNEPVPYLGKYSATNVAISTEADPIWDALEHWRAAAAAF
jgi:hypothetical protein